MKDSTLGEYIYQNKYIYIDIWNTLQLCCLIREKYATKSYRTRNSPKDFAIVLYDSGKL